jgi:hypothetical protein
MRSNYQVISPSGTTNFLPINVTSISNSSPNAIHVAHATNFDELWLNAFNYSNEDAILYLMLGGNNNHQTLPIVIPTSVGLVPVIAGHTFTGSVSISAYASVTNSISILGRINRIIFT